MIGAGQGRVVLALAMMACGTPTAAAATSANGDYAAFSAAIDAYRQFVVPICTPDAVRAYSSFNHSRDAAFVASLQATDLATVYRKAVREKAARDERTFYHCDGPPAPLPPSGSRRDSAIVRVEDKLRRSAASIRSFFDAADATFATLVAERDAALTRKGSR